MHVLVAYLATMGSRLTSTSQASPTEVKLVGLLKQMGNKRGRDPRNREHISARFSASGAYAPATHPVYGWCYAYIDIESPESMRPIHRA